MPIEACQCISVVPTHGKQRQRDHCKFKISLVYLASSKEARATWGDTVLNQVKPTHKNSQIRQTRSSDKPSLSFKATGPSSRWFWSFIGQYTVGR